MDTNAPQFWSYLESWSPGTCTLARWRISWDMRRLVCVRALVVLVAALVLNHDLAHSKQTSLNLNSKSKYLNHEQFCSCLHCKSACHTQNGIFTIRMKSKLILAFRDDYIFVMSENCLIWKHHVLSNFVVIYSGAPEFKFLLGDGNPDGFAWFSSASN
jgi:hypothetical protein